MCGKVSVRSPNKQGLMTPRQVSFRCFVADVENAASPTEGNKKKKLFASFENQMMSVKEKAVERLKPAHRENVYNVCAVMSVETLFGLVFPSA